MARNERTLRDYALPNLDMFRGTMTNDLSQHLKRFAGTRIDHDMRQIRRKNPTKVLPHQKNGPTNKGNFNVQIIRRRKPSRNMGYPHHRSLEWLRLQTFYNGLDMHSRPRLNGAG
ncbi:hypothetical protein EPI10_034465 [Gossypium australe]|uniref:Uncharacterized protein n=1 Tax=Gossypium australe TaxID=47621 RepID=A0A5B6U3Z8_9ROSI|nr:hypothetical protein EPI10_034465 [Gossypium australe]